MTNAQPSELTVVTKDLCSYVMTVTQKSPKQFRFTFVSRLQNLSLDIVECIYRASVLRSHAAASPPPSPFTTDIIWCNM
jgi:hypothetical protein